MNEELNMASKDLYQRVLVDAEKKKSKSSIT